MGLEEIILGIFIYFSTSYMFLLFSAYYSSNNSMND